MRSNHILYVALISALGTLGIWQARRAMRRRKEVDREANRAGTAPAGLDFIDEGSWESFPASDPPSTMTPTKSLG